MRLLLVSLFCSIAGLRAMAVTEQEIRRVLGEHDIVCDSNIVEQLMVESMVKAVDRYATIVSSNEAAGLVNGETIAKAEEWEEGICYLKLNGLYAEGGTQVVSRLRDWAGADKSGIIIDVRGASGNNLAAVDQITGAFARTNTMVYAVADGKNRIVEKHEALQGENAGRMPPSILLVDGETRDACEVLTAVLKEMKWAMLIGVTTKGDNGVREALPLSPTNFLYIATKRIIPESGVGYDGVGIQPGIVVLPAGTNSVHTNEIKALADSDAIRALWKPLSEKAKRDRDLMQRVTSDPALVRATDILLGLKGLQPNDEKTSTNTENSARQ
jgi:C-terminal processing protease CtpA/Prc